MDQVKRDVQSNHVQKHKVQFGQLECTVIIEAYMYFCILDPGTTNHRSGQLHVNTVISQKTEVHVYQLYLITDVHTQIMLSRKIMVL